MSSHARETLVRAWARLVKAQQIALASIEDALKSAGLPPLARVRHVYVWGSHPAGQCKAIIVYFDALAIRICRLAGL